MKNKTNHKREHGIALLFALSILALLLVMALAFTTNSMFEKKAAFNSAKGSSSRLLAQSAIQTIRVILETYNSDQVKCSQGVVDTSLYGNDQPTYDMLEYLTTRDGSVELFKWQTSYQNFINWQYVRAGNRLIGRYAFVIQPAYGIDANYLTKSVAPGVDEGGYNEERIGQEYHEINVRSVSESDITSTIAGRFNYTPAVAPAPAGTFTNDWIDFSTMFSAAKLNITDGSLQAKFRKWFVINANKGEEAFWVDLDNDNVIDTIEKYHRFNLKRSTALWTAMGNAYPPATMYSQILLDADADGTPDALPTVWNNTSANDGTGIPWLAFFGYKDDGTLDLTTAAAANFGLNAAGVIARRRQIAANLVDYCDSDSNPTSDVNPANWAATMPTFTGNEKTPYINEFTIDIECQTNVSPVPPAAGPYDVDANIALNFGVELVNMYSLSSGVNYSIRVIGDVDYGSGWSHFDQSQALTLAAGYTTGDGSLDIDTISIASGVGTPNATVPPLKVRLDRVILSDNSGNNIDIANFNNVEFNFPNGFFMGHLNKRYLCRALEVKDPRQNLNAGSDDSDWNYTLADFPIGDSNGAGASATLARTAAKATLGSVNSNGTLIYSPVNWYGVNTTDSDKETATDNDENVSTAYIRNAPMESPWELGFIHRGAPYQTINLTEYNPNKAIKYVAGTPNVIPGGLEFSDIANGGGDANILDQIKMTGAYEMKKVNINTQYVDPDTGKNFVLRALLDQIQIGCSLDATMTINSMSRTGNTITAVDDLANAIATRTTGIDYITRAAVINCKSAGGSFALRDGTCGVTQDTNAKQEELIGKFINLTDVAGTAEYFNVIVLAQTIKDVGGGAVIKLDGTDVTTAYGQFDYRISAGDYFYADKITSQQKIKVLLYLDSGAGECKILRYEYVE